MCQPKEVGGMGFRSLAKFNVAFLVKQGWRILTNPNSLVAQIIKAKYFPSESFLNSRLGNNCSFTWKSIWAAKGVLSDGMCWKVCNGSRISTLEDSWIPDFNNARLSSYVNNLCDFKVAELIDESSRKWKEEVIVSTFPADVAVKILRIPLSKEAHDDILAWSGAPSGELIVRSAYKLLHGSEIDPSAYALQTDYRNFYKKLWVLNLPSKIKITIWRISWNYLPTRVNMHLRRISNNSICPQCGKGAETNNYVFRKCPVTKTVWKELSFTEILKWLTWVFEQCNPFRREVFCCTIWAIWGDRNKQVHEKISRFGKETTNFIQIYISELQGIKEKIPKNPKEAKSWKHPPDQTVKINFDAAFDGKTCQAAMGIVARNSEGSVLLSFSKIHSQVESTFAAEAIACRITSQLGIDMQWPNLIIEGDALTIIKKCKTKNGDKSKIRAYIQDIHRISQKIKDCRFEHIPRVANRLEHIIASETLKGKEEIYLIGSTPAYVEQLKVLEMKGSID
ncbi:reverse transcriptase [Gossypium australe]|uniref:Reverse transcriptase n=1 Tax=Gossypium australe TaxID=47621 RepID=A0A5B6WLV2_9ROSI|nr:reverse transcriptase [Gossypium australe]